MSLGLAEITEVVELKSKNLFFVHNYTSNGVLTNMTGFEGYYGT